jgi:hypothetical protein
MDVLSQLFPFVFSKEWHFSKEKEQWRLLLGLTKGEK